MGPFKYLFWGLAFPFTKSCVEGAQTTIYCAVDESLVIILCLLVEQWALGHFVK
jgi:hypothetical protein